MYALIKDSKVVTYPYKLSDLRKDNPNVSFPKHVGEDLFAKYGAVRVSFSELPAVSFSQELKEDTPVFLEGQWSQVWKVVDLPEEEVNSRVAKKAEDIRLQRNRLVEESDWTQIADAPVNKTKWATYRQALRDIPSQEGFPLEVVWPDPPTA
jgi:hypothetical protein